MREIEQAEKAVTDRIKSLQKVRDRLGRARKQVESGKQMVLALESLADGDVDRSRGVDFALFKLFDRMFPGVLTGMGVDAALRTQATEWLNSTFGTTAVEESAVRRAAVQFLSVKLGGNEEVSQLAGTYLCGEKTTAE